MEKAANATARANSESDFHSSHCDKCINFAHCNKIRILRKSRPDETFPSCPIIYCRLNCGHQFHECKRDEHELLCPKLKVHCINKDFGCPLVMERGRRGRHLETCPASVIVCTMEWNRWPMPPGKSQPFAMDPLQLDVASKLRDQRILSEWKEFVPSTLRYLLKTNVNEKHPVMPLGVSGLRIPKSILNQAIIEQSLQNEADYSESTESEHDESSDSPWGWKKCPPGLQESVCNKLKSLKVSSPSPLQDVEDSEPPNLTHSEHIEIENNGANDDDFHSCDSSVPDQDQDEEQNHNTLVDSNSNADNNVDVDNGCTGKKKDVDLSLMVEVRTRCQRKPDSMYTFMCSREFRRDEYPNHFSSIHSGIHTQLNGWLYTRCPLSNQGCGFGLDRITPIDDKYKVIYNPVADAFCFTQKVNAALKHKTDENAVSISSLPFEILVHLTKYLDPLSLNTLSMTSRLFRDVCSCIVVERGIVVFQWEKKTDQLGWEITEKKWLYSSSFSPIRKWKFNDVGPMITHLQNCPFFDRNIQTKPFKYPVTQDQL